MDSLAGSSCEESTSTCSEKRSQYAVLAMEPQKCEHSGLFREEDMQWWREEDWMIDGDEITLRKKLISSSCETVYSGYWHGNVVVHARKSSNAALKAGVIADINTLTNIRHENIQLFIGVSDNLSTNRYENIQLFIGVSDNLLTDYIGIVVDPMKGYSLHHLIHKQGKQFSCQSITTIGIQIAQGIAYLHGRKIFHPMLSSKSVTLDCRVRISMLSHYGASDGQVDTENLAYLPPEAVKTVRLLRPCEFSATLSIDPAVSQTAEANIYSFGTLCFEMLAGEKPYSNTPTSTIISLVSSPDRVLPLDGLPISGKYKCIITNCWRYSDRPNIQRDAENS